MRLGELNCNINFEFILQSWQSTIPAFPTCGTRTIEVTIGVRYVKIILVMDINTDKLTQFTYIYMILMYYV